MTAAHALTDAQQLVASWRTGVLSLDPERVPCPGMLWRGYGPNGREGVWRGVHRAMLAFLDEWGEAAVSFGWSTQTLFGVHVLAGARRADSTGALVTVFPRRVVDVAPGAIRLERAGAVQVYRRMPNPAESVPVWDYRWDEAGPAKTAAIAARKGAAP